MKVVGRGNLCAPSDDNLTYQHVETMTESTELWPVYIVKTKMASPGRGTLALARMVSP
jgi:hypothetical protein